MAGGGAEVKVVSDALREGEGVGDEAVVVEGDVEMVRVVKWWHLFWCSL